MSFQNVVLYSQISQVSDGRSFFVGCSGKRGLLSLLCRLLADVMLVEIVPDVDVNTVAVTC